MFIMMHRTTSLRFLPQKPIRQSLKRFMSERTNVSLAEDLKKTRYVKDFNEIPGPIRLPYIGTSYLYLFGGHSAKQHKASFEKCLKYGPIVREEIEGNSVVRVFDYKDMEHLFLSDNNKPERERLHAVNLLRKDHPHLYKSVKEEDRLKLHEECQKALNSAQVVGAYLPDADGLIRKFIDIHAIQHKDDFFQELLRLSLQLTSLVTFDQKTDCFSNKELKPGSMSTELIQAIVTSNHFIGAFDTVPDPRSVPVLWKHFEKAMLFLEEVVVESVKRRAKSLPKENVEKSGVPSLLEFYLTSPNLGFKDAVRMSVDLLLGGVQTFACTASFALYHLAMNERVQNFLRIESQKILHTSQGPVTTEILAKAPYAQAVLKEVFRMNPLSNGLRRIATQDLVLSGYHIPKGTTIVIQNQSACRLQRYFVRPNEFLPERWIKGSPVEVEDNPFLVLPFGYGSRSCVAQHLAQQFLLTFLLRSVQNHAITWNSERPLDCINPMDANINRPDQQLKFTFSKLS